MQQRDPRGNCWSAQVLGGFVQMCVYTVVQEIIVLLLAFSTCFVFQLPSISCAAFTQFRLVGWIVRCGTHGVGVWDTCTYDLLIVLFSVILCCSPGKERINAAFFLAADCRANRKKCHPCPRYCVLPRAREQLQNSGGHSDELPVLSLPCHLHHLHRSEKEK